MFTITQIEDAHSKVKSGADFPKYIQDIIALGVAKFTTYVSDSHTVYASADGETAKSAGKYAEKEIAKEIDLPKFKQQLKIHQEGKTEYFKFCEDCAETGVDKWIVDLSAMTCIYYDEADNEMLVEYIPQG